MLWKNIVMSLIQTLVLTTDILAAQRAKIKSIAVLSGHSIREELQFYNPDFIIPNITYIPKILPQLFPDDKFE